MLIPQSDPHRIVLDDGHQRLSAAECQRAIACIASALRDAGLQPGDCVALLSRNQAQYPLWLLGAIVAGLWVVPVNWHLKPGEIRHIVSDSDAGLLLCEPELALPELSLPQWPLDSRRWDDIMQGTPRGWNQNDPAGGIMLYTSGTTGRPKGVRRSQPATLGALHNEWQRRGAAVGLDGSGPHLVTGPLYHAAPLLYALYDWVNGAPLLIMRRFDAGAALEWIDRAAVRHTHWVPTMFVRALRLPEEQRRHFRGTSLDLVLHGAAPIAPELKRQWIEWWGPVLVEYWGGSESGVVTRVDSSEWLSHPGTVGRALPFFEVFSVDEGGRPQPPGETGRLAVRARDGGRIFHYFNDPDKTERHHLGDALLLGDIGYVDAEGYVYLVGRESHTIISGGVNIYPAEIEAVLSAHPEVVDVVVCGEPDPEWGEAVIARVQALPGRAGDALERELLASAEAQLARYKVPRRIDWVKRLPRTDTGKLLRSRTPNNP